MSLLHPYRVAPAADAPPAESWSKHIVAALIVVIAVAILLVVWFWGAGAERRAVEALPQTDRAALYERTLENLRWCKSHPTEGFENFCKEQATFAQSFPDCGKECRALLPERGPRR